MALRATTHAHVQKWAIDNNMRILMDFTAWIRVVDFKALIWPKTLLELEKCVSIEFLHVPDRGPELRQVHQIFGVSITKPTLAIALIIHTWKMPIELLFYGMVSFCRKLNRRQNIPMQNSNCMKFSPWAHITFMPHFSYSIIFDITKFLITPMWWLNTD